MFKKVLISRTDLLEACDPSKIPNLRDPEFLKGDEDDDDRDFDDDYTIAIGQKQFSSQNKGMSAI